MLWAMRMTAQLNLPKKVAPMIRCARVMKNIMTRNTMTTCSLAENKKIAPARGCFLFFWFFDDFSFDSFGFLFALSRFVMCERNAEDIYEGKND